MESTDLKASGLGKRGRPRSEKSRRAILDAALRLVEERGCGSAVTMQAIAHHAGVGKQTLYKWWGSTADIFLEILNETAEKEIDVSGQTREKRLEFFLVATFKALKPTIRIILKTLMAKAIADSEFRTKFMRELIEVRRGALEKVLAQSDSLIIDDSDIAIDFIFGLMWYRLLLDMGTLDTAEGIRIARLLQSERYCQP